MRDQQVSERSCCLLKHLNNDSNNDNLDGEINCQSCIQASVVLRRNWILLSLLSQNIDTYSYTLLVTAGDQQLCG